MSRAISSANATSDADRDDGATRRRRATMLSSADATAGRHAFQYALSAVRPSSPQCAPSLIATHAYVRASHALSGTPVTESGSPVTTLTACAADGISNP